MIELCETEPKPIKSVASHTRTPGPDTGQRHDILLSPRCDWEFGQQNKSQVEQVGHAKITQTDAFNYMSYHFLCKRGIRPARTEQFLVRIFRILSGVMARNLEYSWREFVRGKQIAGHCEWFLYI